MHWLRFGGHVPWSTSGTISEDSSFGDVLHSLLGYADRPTVLQAIVWFTYLVVSTILFVRLGEAWPSQANAGVAARVSRPRECESIDACHALTTDAFYAASPKNIP